MPRVVLVALWLSAAGAMGLLVFAVYAARQTPVAHAEPPIDRLPARQPYNPRARWTVTEHFSAHHVLVAQVETEHLNEALVIAQQLTEPVREKYSEVLIYFHRPGRPDRLPPRRVQWTPTSGYVETRYD